MDARDLLMPQNRWMWCVLYGHSALSGDNGKCGRCGETRKEKP